MVAYAEHGAVGRKGGRVIEADQKLQGYIDQQAEWCEKADGRDFGILFQALSATDFHADMEACAVGLKRIETNRLSREAACRMFGVHPALVAHCHPSIGGAIERAGQQFIAGAAKWAVEKHQRP